MQGERTHSLISVKNRLLKAATGYTFTALFRGVLAQLVERLNGIEEVRGSNPLGSTSRVQSDGETRKPIASASHVSGSLIGPQNYGT